MMGGEGMNTYSTAEVAKIIGVHPNTVRLYEKLKLIQSQNAAQMDIAFLPICILNSFGLPAWPSKSKF